MYYCKTDSPNTYISVYNLGNFSFTIIVRPPSNKKLFPVHRPGVKRADWNFLFHISKNNF